MHTRGDDSHTAPETKYGSPSSLLYEVLPILDFWSHGAASGELLHLCGTQCGVKMMSVTSACTKSLWIDYKTKGVWPRNTYA